MNGFKYKRRSKSVKTAEFSYDDVVTPGHKRSKRVTKKNKGKSKKGSRNNVARINNPRHDPNANTRPSKRRDVMDSDTQVRHEQKRGRTKQDTSYDNETLIGKCQTTLPAARVTGPINFLTIANSFCLIAPMYPTEVVSGRAIRERVHLSSESNKLHALLQEVLRSETSLLTKDFTGKFQFVVNALKGVSREFMQKVREEDVSTHETQGLAKNSRNVQLTAKKENIENILTQLKKEETDWIAAKDKLNAQIVAADQAQPETVVAEVSVPEVDKVQANMQASVQGISVQVRGARR